MNKLNDYGIVSGWHLFELADRAVLAKLQAKNPNIKYWLTNNANITFVRQSSETDMLTVDAVFDYVSDTYASVVVNIISNNRTQAIIHLSYKSKDHLAVKPANVKRKRNSNDK